MAQYDCSWEALTRPELRPVFVARERIPQFQTAETGFSVVNAWWLSNLSHLAYYDASLVEQALPPVGLQLLASFAQESNQAFLVAADSYAVLVFRGTESNEMADLKTDADIRLVSISGGAKVHKGLLAALDGIWSTIEEKFKERATQDRPIWFTGHSLGAALATLAATRMEPASVYAFGLPRMGDAGLVKLLDGISVQRVVNCSDVVATMPPRSIGYRHVGEHQFITSSGKLLTNPSGTRVMLSKIVGAGRYYSSYPWLQSENLKIRSMADHTIGNYTFAFGRTIAQGKR